MIIQKYGGSSLKNARRITNVTNIIKSYYEKHGPLVVVVSAVGGITDMLIDAAKSNDKTEIQEIYSEVKKRHEEICKELGVDFSLVSRILGDIQQYIDIEDPDNQTMDVIQSFGERMSSRIVSAYLNKIGIDSTQYDAWDAGFVTNDDFCNAEILPETFSNIKEKLSNNDGVAVVTGFIAKTKEGDITTLGRGGSDYTASIIGAALDAEEVEIWTDVNGIMTADPGVVRNAKTVPVVSFAEASELAFFGAKVLHPKTILPVMDKGIPVKIFNAFEPDHPGTAIVNELRPEETAPHKAIAFKKSITLLSVTSLRMVEAYGFLAKVFEIFAQYRIPVDMLATSEISVSITLDPKYDVSKVVEELEKFSKVKIEEDKSLICVVGETNKSTPGESARVFRILGDHNINIEMISQGASEINISFVINQPDLEKAVNALHSRLFE